MNKIKTILIISIAIFGAACLPVGRDFCWTENAYAQPEPLVVQFETAPLFNEVNFMPGASVARWVKVTNNSGSIQRIATEAINKTDPNNLSEKLNLTIKENTAEIFHNTLKKFFDQGETYLSSLANGATTQYDFTITFDANTDDTFQGKTLGFDIIVGFEGTEGGLPLPAPGEGTRGNGGIGDSLPPGLTIYNETNSSIADTSVTIDWLTSYNSTSQVIYAAQGEAHSLDLSDSGGIPPDYGYAHTTPEYDIATKVMSHSVTITGLLPNTTYYYRTVSHASLAIGQELSFQTLGIAPPTPPAPFTPPITLGSETGKESEVVGAATENKEKLAMNPAEEEQPAPTEETATKPFLNLLAGVFGLTSFNFRTILLILLIIIIIIIILFTTKKKKKEKFNLK